MFGPGFDSLQLHFTRQALALAGFIFQLHQVQKFNLISVENFSAF